MEDYRKGLLLLTRSQVPTRCDDDEQDVETRSEFAEVCLHHQQRMTHSKEESPARPQTTAKDLKLIADQHVNDLQRLSKE
jgi:hypothetical protein